MATVRRRSERSRIMKDGIIYKSDGETLKEIYRAFDIDGNLKRPLTIGEMVLIFAIGKKIIEHAGKEIEIRE